MSSTFFGRLTIGAFEHGPIETTGALSIIAVAIAVAILLTYFKRWKWLWKEWLTTTDHKKIGVMYILVAILMLFRGFIDVAMLRAQQAVSVGNNQGFLTSDHFQQIFTAHGVLMIFFVAMGLLFGIVNLVTPLQIGARDVAFPFLNSVSFWLFVAGVILVNLSLIIGEFAATGWLAYPPLSELQYSPGVGVDYYIWSLQLSGIGSTLSGINFLVTILKLRCPGMTMMKMPMFVWAVFGAMILVAFAFPILTATLGMLTLDRTLGMHFFTSGFGGNPMMYVNLIWAWGHPEVYILILPAFGVFSEVVATFSKKRLFGYTSMVVAIMAIVFLSFLVWLHHFFTMGAGADVNAFFGIMTMVIAIPTGVKVFNWLFTMYRGRVWFTTAMKWFMGFVVTFTLGGMAGVLMAIPGVDYELHNSLFLVAHFHTMIIGGVLFGMFAAGAYWFPKFAGFRLNERSGTWAFWCWLIGFLLAFVPLYILGMLGATRRLDHYSASTGWQGLFIVAGVGVVIIGFGLFFQVLQVILSVRNRKDNLDLTGDPWDGRTLEWSIPSPPPHYNFAIIPTVTGRDAFWDTKYGRGPQALEPVYEDIHMPRNSASGLIIGLFAAAFGFAVIWHIWWLVIVGLLGVASTGIVRSFDENTSYYIPAAEVAETEARLRHAH
jgi:cytochrome o ubiquinol oxidase subunit 1